MRIAIANLGLGNLRSVEHALRTVAPNAHIEITCEPESINSADKIVVPGQGAMHTWFDAMQQKKMHRAISQSLQEKPVLGICVGMQALFSYSEEGAGCTGFNIFEGRLRHFSQYAEFKDSQKKPKSVMLKVPHVGWNRIHIENMHPLWQSIDEDAYFYFVHSYCVQYQASDYVIASCDYGMKFTAAVARGNMFAVQFHPEKSHKNGLQLIKNFCDWDGRA